MMRTLFLNPPSYDGFDGSAGSRYQARREVKSFWYPTWLAYPAAMIRDSRLLDAPAEGMDVSEVLRLASDYELVVIHTSTPTLQNDKAIAERLKERSPHVRIGFVGPHATVLPRETLSASDAVDFAAIGEFDYTIKEYLGWNSPQGRPGNSFPAEWGHPSNRAEAARREP